jgi:hypothetical protein
MVKLLVVAFTLGKVCVKKGAPPVSLLTDTSIVTPIAGIPLLTLTCKGKVGPMPGASTLPLTGVVDACRAISAHGSSLPLSLQAEIVEVTEITTRAKRIDLIIDYQ